MFKCLLLVFGRGLHRRGKFVGDNFKRCKLFMGLAVGGAWAYFDEFNRIEKDVLFVVAQRMQMIQTAVAKRLDHFDFDGCWTAIKFTCNAFITMNPGYIGRSDRVVGLGGTQVTHY